MADEPTTTTTTTTRTCSCSCCDILWIVTTKEGWLKLIQAITTFLTFVICSAFPNTNKPEYEFLIFVATTLFVFVVLYIVLGTTHLLEKLPPALRHPILGVVFCLLAALALLIGSAIVYARGSDYDIRTLEASGICGFVSSALFLFEGVYYIILYRRVARRHAEQKTAEDEQPDDFVQPSKPEY